MTAQGYIAEAASVLCSCADSCTVHRLPCDTHLCNTPLNVCLYCSLQHKHEGRNSEFLRIIIRPTNLLMCRDSSVVTATRYGLDGPRTESTRGQDFPHPSRPGPTILLYSGYRVSFPRSKRPGRVVDHPLQCGAAVEESTAILLLLWAFTPCSRVNFTFTYELSAQCHTLFCKCLTVGSKNYLIISECAWIQNAVQPCCRNRIHRPQNVKIVGYLLTAYKTKICFFMSCSEYGGSSLTRLSDENLR